MTLALLPRPFHSVRLAEENQQFRLPERQDIVPGARIFEVRHNDFELRLPYRVLILETAPITKEAKLRLVVGYVVNSFNDQRLYNGRRRIPLAEFLGKQPHLDPETGLLTQYWLRAGN